MTAIFQEEQRVYARLYAATASSLVMNPRGLGCFPNKLHEEH